MKYKWLASAGLVVVTAVTTVQATPVAGFNGTATLDSASSPGNDITVTYSVDLTAGIYTYDYTINNPATDSTTVDFFNVGFDASAPGAVLGGNYLTASSGGVNWLITPVQPGFSSSLLFFTSDLAPTWGNANAQDHNPPSPWASYPGGNPVPVPNVPDGGATVMLLGIALSGVGLLRKKLIA